MQRPIAKFVESVRCWWCYVVAFCPHSFDLETLGLARISGGMPVMFLLMNVLERK